jgi:hypothetical protein
MVYAFGMKSMVARRKNLTHVPGLKFLQADGAILAMNFTFMASITNSWWQFLLQGSPSLSLLPSFFPFLQFFNNPV